MPIQPIKPSEVIVKKQASIPDEVFESFNELITIYFNGYSASFKQDEIASLIVAKMKLEGTKQIYHNHWLDVEEIYRNAGWVVEYDKPGFNEDYDAYFKFSKKKNS